MNRFIAILWNHRADHARADSDVLIAGVAQAHPSWPRRWDLPGVVVFEAPQRSRAEAGLVVGETALFIGAVFAGNQCARSADMDAAGLVSTGGEAAFARSWGRYVLIVRDETNACAYIARDPSGALPCFMAQRGWAFAFFSHPDDVEALVLGELSVDWAYLAQRLANNRVVTTRTGIVGVETLAPGAIARVGQGKRSVRQVWSAGRVAARSARVRKQASAQLRETIETSCAAWASCFDRVGIRLSGGLDSSIVLSCLDPCSEVRAINFATMAAEGDERAYARAAARFAKVKLHEALRNPARVDLEAAVKHAPSLNPHLWLADTETDAVEAAFAREHGLQAYFSGRGGDNVFFRSEHPHALADWLARQGAGPTFWRRCWGYASETGQPWTRALRDAFVLAMGRGDRQNAKPSRFLSAKARALIAEAAAEPHLDLLPGKRLHLRLIEDRLNYFDHRAHADYIYPLVSQPVIELCLGLPSFMLSPAAADRGLARQAFAGRLAPEILARRSKGRTNSYLAEILMRHAVFLRRYLLDGELAGAGLVSGDALGGALSETGLMRHAENMPTIVGLLSVEAWLRNRPCGIKSQSRAS
jgi:asparagine synthase (glutamine-hydrolysing)